MLGNGNTEKGWRVTASFHLGPWSLVVTKDACCHSSVSELNRLLRKMPSDAHLKMARRKSKKVGSGRCQQDAGRARQHICGRPGRRSPGEVAVALRGKHVEWPRVAAAPPCRLPEQVNFYLSLSENTV